QHAVEHGDIDVRSPARALAVEERRSDRAEGYRAGQAVGDRFTNHGWRSVGKAGDADQSAHALNHRVVGAFPAVGAGRPKPRDRRQDERRVDLSQRLIAEAVALERSGSEVLRHHVGTSHELAEELAVGMRFDVEPDTLLTPIDVGKIGTLSIDQRPERTRYVPGRRT